MNSNQKNNLIPEEVVMSKIYVLRNQKVMLDDDLAMLYGVETKRINEQVKRNYGRFPEDFMFQLTEEEFINLKSQIATSSWGGRRTLPYAFSEHGVLMLSSVLNSEMAIKVNIRIMRVYIKLREMILLNLNIIQRLDLIEKRLSGHDRQVITIFEYLKQLELIKQQESEQKNRRRVGYKSE